MKKIIFIILFIMFHVEHTYASNKASQVDFLISGLVDSSGRALTGGKVYFYTAGSYSNLKTIWTDKDKTTTAANPITLDAYGKKSVFADGFYNIEVQNSSSALLYKIPNLYFGHYDALTYDPQDYADINTAINAISSTNATLEIRSSVDIGTTTIIPSNVKLRFARGGQLTKTASGSLTISGSIEAPPDKVFSGFSVGDVVFGNGNIVEVYPQWWGLSESESAANNEVALESAIRSTIGKVVIPEGTYNCNSILIDKSITLEGTGYRSSILNFASGITSPVIINDAGNVRLKNIEIQTAGANSIGITVSGTSSGYSFDSVFVQHPIGAGVGAYGIYLLANEEALEGDIKNCTMYRPYYAIYSEGAYQNKRVSVEDSKIDTATYCIYDAGSSTNWVITGNKFIDFSKLGILTKSDGVIINDNLFEISGTWDSFDGSTNTKNPIFMGTGSTKLSAYGNVFRSNGTETNDRGKLFYANNSTGGTYYFNDPYDGIRFDGNQRFYGNSQFTGIATATATMIVSQVGSQTGNMVSNQNSAGAVISGVNSQGNPFETIKTVTSDSGILTLDLSTGSTFFCDLTENIGTVTINNAADGIAMRLLLKQGAGAYNIERADFPSNVKFNNNTYAIGSTNNKMDMLTFLYFGTSTGLNIWVESSDRTTNIPE